MERSSRKNRILLSNTLYIDNMQQAYALDDMCMAMLKDPGARDAKMFALFVDAANDYRAKALAALR